MTETERKALALLNGPHSPYHYEAADHPVTVLARAIEAHEAFKREASVEMQEYSKWCKSTGQQFPLMLERFIIAKSDPLVEALSTLGWAYDGLGPEQATALRAALAAHGLEIKEIG